MIRRLYRVLLRDFMAGRILPIIAAQHPDCTRSDWGRWSYDSADVVLQERDKPPVLPKAPTMCALGDE